MQLTNLLLSYGFKNKGEPLKFCCPMRYKICMRNAAVMTLKTENSCEKNRVGKSSRVTSALHYCTFRMSLIACLYRKVYIYRARVEFFRHAVLNYKYINTQNAELTSKKLTRPLDY